MKKIFFILLLIIPSSQLRAQNYNDQEGYPDRDLFGNYVVIRLTNLCLTRSEAISELNKFKEYCEENPYLKPYTAFLGIFQVKSIEKDKSNRWFGGYCNYKRQKKELYEMDQKFLQMYCTSAEIFQFKGLIKNEFCFEEEKK